MPLDRFPSAAEVYAAKRTNTPLATGMTPLDAPRESPRARERSCVECTKLPVPVMLAGYDRARTSLYDWGCESR